ncbi:signal peptidase I [Cellulomonas composti]|uniref:Signal peptidase I n=1 Tax=Cellulomonas composti TaxID=266130 RepID=A0A511JCN9_9CELL|nr:signal peptidase I [Cellulomonas composti]GEL95760.1 hypothetical protein CCO02nite_24180 [Cellulomonas composti]
MTTASAAAASARADRRGGKAPVATVARKPAWRRALSVVLWTIVVVGVLAYATSIAVPLWFQAQGQRLMIVTSGSMAPTFDAGDAVVMRKVSDPSELKVGQIVAFWPTGSQRLVTHRIIELVTLPKMATDPKTGQSKPVLDEATGEPTTDRYIVTKGDANNVQDDNATPYTRVRGIVLSAHPGWGWVLQWTGSAQGRAVMLVPPLAALGTLELLALRDARQRRRQTTPTRDERHVDAFFLD